MDLTAKYRPSSFKDVVGQDTIIQSLNTIIQKDGNLPNSLLFTGPSGCGKTTLARCCAYSVNCIDYNIIELDAASNSSVEDTRSILEQIRFLPFGGNKKRIIIIDECHRLSKQAFDTLLKSIEEPPPHTTWIWCSTEPEKIPKTILTRCLRYDLKKVTPAKVLGLLKSVVESEKFTLDKSILNLIAMRCDGSPRQALKYLEALHESKSVQEAQELIKSIDKEETPSVIQLARVLVSKGTWEDGLKAIRDTEEDAEGIRIGVVNYVNKCIISSKDLENTKRLLQILYAFSKPCNPSEKLAPIFLAMATVLIDD